MAACERGSGSAGPSCQTATLPFETDVDSTLVVAAPPVSPPIRYRFVPDANVPEPVRPCGRFHSGGLPCHGTTAPAGAGQGRLWLLAGHRLTGEMALKPRSIVGETVK